MAIERVLMTADTVGGVWTFALELSRGLALRGVDVALATMGAPLSREQRRDAERIPRLQVYESSFRLEWMSEPWDDVRRAGEWLLALEGRCSPDALHLNQFCFGALPFSAPILVTGHSCVLSWWRAVRGGDAPPEWDRYAGAVRRGLGGAGLVTAPTWAMMRELEQHYGPLPRKLVILNGRALQGLGRRNRLPHMEKQPIIFTAGRIWDEAKNLRALEEIASDLPWPVYVAGDHRGPEGGGRDCLRCHFLGRLDSNEMAHWMRRASIYALPAIYEPFGLSVLEAALAGCALVLGDIPSLRELWSDAALFVSPASSEALARALRRLAGSVEERTGLAARARQRALEFNPDRMTEEYLRAYEAMPRAMLQPARGPRQAEARPA